MDWFYFLEDYLKLWLYEHSFLIIYTPLNEHFGIVPIESMYLMRPVLATNSGGPLETIVNGKTGFLCDNNPNSFCQCMVNAINKFNKIQKMGKNSRNHVIENFSFSSFVDKLNKIISEVYDH